MVRGTYRQQCGYNTVVAVSVDDIQPIVIVTRFPLHTCMMEQFSAFTLDIILSLVLLLAAYNYVYSLICTRISLEHLHSYQYPVLLVEKLLLWQHL